MSSDPRWYNHRWEVITAIQAELAKWTDPTLVSFAGYPLQIANIYPYWREPKLLTAEELPALFYRYGASRENNDIAGAVNLKGETTTLIIHAIVEGQYRQKNDDAWILEKTALQCATEIHLMLETFVNHNQNIGGTAAGPGGQHRTDALRLRRMTPENEKVSDRETLEFHIEFDHLYPA